MVKKTKHVVIFSLLAVLIIAMATGSIFLYQSWRNQQGKIYPKLYLGSYQLGGLSQDEALRLISEKSAELSKQGLNFSYNNKKLNVGPIVSAGSDAYAINVFTLDPEKNLQLVLDYQGQGFLAYLRYRWQILFKNPQLQFSYDLDREELTKILNEAFHDQEIPAVNAGFKLASEKDLNFQLEAEKAGKIIDYEAALNEVENNLARLNQQTIFLKTKTEYPEVYQKDLPALEADARAILSQGEITLNFKDKKWLVNLTRIASWLKTEKKDSSLSLGLDQEKIQEFLKDKIAPEIDKEAALPRFSMINSRLANWQLGEDGQKLNLESSSQKIQKEFIEDKKNSIELEVDVVKTDNSNPENNLNIKEIIGTGHSNFSGSPANRRHNIKVGADTLNGLLIKPGEEFSLVKTLGDVEEGSGYLPELVIKNNKTVPEYGGGLCQIGTTVFRAAMQSGLPITERRNHSYRVSYYEPAGMDAAIYIPKPDVRFLNDTGNYILIQARIEKSDLYFDFWGVSDGRQVEISKPTIYNIVKPGPTKIIETTDLKPGEKKCTEKAHNGADAFFDYKVVYAQANSSEDATKKVRFNSHYVPWQEVCLVGVSASSTASSTASTSPIIATSTNPDIESATNTASSSQTN
ncbi:MAG: VanW family protein [Patescibacteria group bacterium]